MSAAFWTCSGLMWLIKITLRQTAAEIMPTYLVFTSMVFLLRALYGITSCSETPKPDRSSVCRQAVPQTLMHTGSVLPSCHTSTRLRTGHDPTLARASACLQQNKAVILAELKKRPLQICVVHRMGEVRYCDYICIYYPQFRWLLSL